MVLIYLSLESRQGSKEMNKSQRMVKIEDSENIVTGIRILQGLYTVTFSFDQKPRK